MAELLFKKERSRFPLIYEAMVWLFYVVLYKYAYYVGEAKLPNENFDDFPHLQLLPYAICMSLYVIPFYRWIAPFFLSRRKYGWFLLAMFAWFLFIPKLTNFCVSYLFLISNDPGGYHTFFTSQFKLYRVYMTHVGGWDFQILLTDFIAFSSVAFTRFAFDNERKKRLLEKDIFRLQLEALKAQINPHFLFNTLNSIYGMSLTGNKETPGYVLRLADIMRYILHDCQHSQVDLEKDISFNENYFEMEKKRFHNTDIRFDITNNSNDVVIAPLLLMPFIENSFKHGAHRVKDNGFIHASLKADNKQLIFEVENDIFAAPVPASYIGGIGVENVKKRLDIYYPGKYELKIENNGKTYKVFLKILFN